VLSCSSSHDAGIQKCNPPSKSDRYGNAGFCMHKAVLYHDMGIELNLTWFYSLLSPTLLAMEKQTIRRGRPPGSSTYDAESAVAFGAAVREERTRQGIAQEALSHLAGVERSHLGKIERGEHVPTLPVILRIAHALRCSASRLLEATEVGLLASKRGTKQ